MINQFTELKNKTNELEDELLNLKTEKQGEKSESHCLNFSRNFSSLEVILPKKIFVARIQPSKKTNIVLQMLVDLTLSVSESVEINLICGEFSIYKYRKVLTEGSNQISIMQNFEPLTTDKFPVYLEITPLTKKNIMVNQISLFAWGDLLGKYSTNYQGIETKDSYLLSILDNNCVYGLMTEKKENEFNLIDFEFIDNAISYSIFYSEKDDIVYFFRVDLNGNLFFSSFFDRYEKFIASGVSEVSADVSDSGVILVSYIKNNKCYYFEIDENKRISMHKRLYCNYVLISKTLCFYNKLKGKFIIIATGLNDNNYLIEQLDETFSNNNTVVAEYSFSVTENGSEL